MHNGGLLLNWHFKNNREQLYTNGISQEPLERKQARMHGSSSLFLLAPLIMLVGGMIA
jgi:hypothetical protein